MTVDLKGIQYFEAFQHPDKFGTLIGYNVTHFDRQAREARVALTVAEDHLSPSSKCHGGVISSLLDYTCGIAACTTLGPADVCATVELKVNYFRPVSLGDCIEATARVVFRGKKLCALTGLLHRQGVEEPVAMATATFNVIEGGSKGDRS